MSTITTGRDLAAQLSTNAAAVSPEAIVLGAAVVLVLGTSGVTALTRLHTAILTTLVDALAAIVKILVVVVLLLVLWLLAERGDATADEPPPLEVSARR